MQGAEDGLRVVQDGRLQRRDRRQMQRLIACLLRVHILMRVFE